MTGDEGNSMGELKKSLPCRSGRFTGENVGGPLLKALGRTTGEGQ